MSNIKWATQLLERYLETLEINDDRLWAKGQALSDRLIWCELDTGDMIMQMTNLLWDVGGNNFLLLLYPIPKIEFSQCIKENMSQILYLVGVNVYFAKMILKNLNQNQLPLEAIGCFIFQLRIMQDALSRVNFG